MLKQSLSQKQLQKLSPQQIQLMKLLQVPSAALEQRIKEELEGNPALEEGREEEKDELDEREEENTEQEETLDLSDYIDEDEVASYKMSSGTYNPDEEDKSLPMPVEKSFHEYLTQQLRLLKFDEKQFNIGIQLIGSIDEDGYLRREIEAIVDDLIFGQNIDATEEEIIAVLKRIQRFDPPGIGATDLQCCLSLQLEKKDQDSETIQLAIKIIDKYFNEFSKKHYEKLIKQLNVSDEELKDAVGEILKLNPKPGSGYSNASGSKSKQYIIPDFLLANKNGELELTLNARNAPDLRVSNNYMEMMKGYEKSDKTDKKQKETVMFIKQKIDSAKWFIDAIKQRQHTMYHTMSTILKLQEDYFLTGDETKLKPMILKDIAEITHLDISTVSRVANSKYIQTEFGNFLLKYFFSESLQTDSGEEVSTREVKKILSNIVDDEDKKKPFSDQKLTDLLKEKGYNIARRTVAKYREQLSIPVARLRKEL